MSTNGKFIHLPQNLLEKLRQDEDLIWLFLQARWLIESFYWQEIFDCQSNFNAVDLSAIDVVLDGVNYELLDERDDEFTMWLQDLKKENPECYKAIKPSVPQILMEALDKGTTVDKDWDVLHYLLTQTTEEELSFFVTQSQESGLLLVNAIRGGTKLKYRECEYLAYLTVDETEQIAQALLQISLEDLRGRFETAVKSSPEIYAATWEVKKFEFLAESFIRLVNYYKEAYKLEHAMLIDIC